MIYCKDELDLLKDEKSYQSTLNRFSSIVQCNGYDPETDRDLSLKDALELPSASFMIPRVLTQFVQEGVEPLLIGSNLLQRIEYTPGLQTIFPAIDILEAAEVGDGMSLPIVNVNIGGAQSMGVNVRRHGLQLRVSQKFIDQSSYPWIQWWMRLAANALARHKESSIFSFISSVGVSIFDNDVDARTDGSAIQPEAGATTGRNIHGEYNGSLTMDDIFTMYTTIMLQGYIPDTMLVHPMTFLSFIRDSTMREFALSAGGGSFFQPFTGNAAAQAFGRQHNFNGLGQGKGQTGQYTKGKLTGGQQSTVEGIAQNMTSAPVLPSYLGMNFKIMVSPFVKFNPLTRTSDIMMFDSKNLGALVVSEDPHVNSWTEPQFNINNIGIEESYGLTILNEAQAVGTAKNVAIKPNEFTLPARAYYNLSDTNSKFQTKEDAGFTEFGATPTDVLAK
jgi:hypothetical protein